MLVLDHGYCNYVTHWGSDEDIIRAARMSTDGAFRGWGPIHDPWCELHKREYHSPETCTPKPGDEKLLAYLWNHDHTSVFEQAGLAVEIQAPIFVAREIFRHRTFSYNELSARYSELPDLHYCPSIERLKASRQSSKNKQGSEEGFTEELAYKFQQEIKLSTIQSRAAYELLLANGVSREIARLCIPMSQYTRWRMSGNLWNWLRFLELRSGEEVQMETREYAAAVAVFLREHFPRTLGLFDESEREKRDIRNQEHSHR